MKYGPRTPWLFLAPHLSLFTIFVLAPIVCVLVLSLFDWNLLGEHHYAGMANFAEIVHDRQFWRALGNTCVFATVIVPATMLCGLGLAIVLNQPLPGRAVFRAAIYLPTVLSSVASATIAAWIFDDEYGVLNAALAKLGLPRVPWLTSTHFAMPALMLTTLWLRTGLCMVVYLAALQDVPRNLIQAAELDGAGAWNRFRYITWPLLKPSSVFLFLTTLIYAFHAFDIVYVMTDGGPAFSTTVLVQYLYEQAFQEQRQGYASAISVILLLLLVSLSSILLIRRRRLEPA